VSIAHRSVQVATLLFVLFESTAQARAECTIRPIEGTVGFRVAQQSQATNAQAFGAVQLAEDALFTSKQVDLDGDGEVDRTEPFQGSSMATRLSNVFNVARIPTIYTGECFADLQPNERRKYGLHSVDLYATAVAYRFPIPGVEPLSFFYASSITGSTMGLADRDAASFGDSLLKSRYNTAYLYGFAALPLAFLGPLAPLLSSDTPPTAIAGDFVTGVEAALPAIGAARVGYAYSQGLFTNVSVDRIRFMLESLLTQRFESLALVKVGFRELPTIDELGATTVYGRRLELAVPRVEDAALQPRELISNLGLTTAHLEQIGMFGYLAAKVAYAVEPKPFIHELRVGLEQTTEQRRKSAKQEDWLDAVEAHAGIVQLPSLPYYAVDGGRRFSFDVSLVLPLGSAVVRGGVQRNAPELLTVFPYAQDATSMRIEVSGTFDDEEESRE
jgi:hypothetical protein